MYALSLTSGRFQASSGAQPKLVWDVLPPRARCARSLREDIASRQHFAPHASEMDSLATAASSIVSDGMPLTYLATTVSAGLLLLLGVASTVSQGSEARENTEETSTKAPTATDSAANAVSSTGSQAVDAKATQRAARSTPVPRVEVTAVREWISAYRSRKETAPAAPSAPSSSAPAAPALSETDITEAETAAVDELVEKISAASPEAVAAAAAVKEATITQSKGMENTSTADSDTAVWPNPAAIAATDAPADLLGSKPGGKSPIEALLAWLKALWAAIVKFFEDLQPNKGSGATA